MMKEPFGGLILNVAFRMLVPFTIVYGVYVLCLGEFSPGGGFQAGALLAVGVLLARLILGFDTKFNVLGKTSVVMAGLGTFLYAFTGWLTIFGGADYFLNYDYMPIVLEPKHEIEVSSEGNVSTALLEETIQGFYGKKREPVEYDVYVSVTSVVDVVTADGPVSLKKQFEPFGIKATVKATKDLYYVGDIGGWHIHGSFGVPHQECQCRL